MTHSDIRLECWAAVKDGQVVGMASITDYTFFQAAKEFKPLEVRRMNTEEAIASFQRGNYQPDLFDEAKP